MKNEGMRKPSAWLGFTQRKEERRVDAEDILLDFFSQRFTEVRRAQRNTKLSS